MPTQNQKFATPKDLYRLLVQVWSSDTASPPESWSPQCPARNHCSVTSLIVQDYFGGEILSTKTSGGTHFYNRINAIKWDLTVSQFSEPEPYDDMLSSRERALLDTSEFKYQLLTSRLKERIEKLHGSGWLDEPGLSADFERDQPIAQECEES